MESGAPYMVLVAAVGVSAIDSRRAEEVATVQALLRQQPWPPNAIVLVVGRDVPEDRVKRLLEASVIATPSVAANAARLIVLPSLLGTAHPVAAALTAAAWAKDGALQPRLTTAILIPPASSRTLDPGWAARLVAAAHEHAAGALDGQPLVVGTEGWVVPKPDADPVHVRRLGRGDPESTGAVHWLGLQAGALATLPALRPVPRAVEFVASHFGIGPSTAVRDVHADAALGAWLHIAHGAFPRVVTQPLLAGLLTAPQAPAPRLPPSVAPGALPLWSAWDWAWVEAPMTPYNDVAAICGVLLVVIAFAALLAFFSTARHRTRISADQQPASRFN